jgi:hypothetical protein
MRKRKNMDIVQNIQKRFQTAMIGSLARVEDYFGFMWGHDEDEEKLTNKQMENSELWEELREEILDHSNYQMRCAINDLKNFFNEISNQNTYKETIKFKFNKEDEELQ